MLWSEILNNAGFSSDIETGIVISGHTHIPTHKHTHQQTRIDAILNSNLPLIGIYILQHKCGLLDE